MKEFTIGPNDAGQRLDRFLAKAVPLLPASLAQKYIRIKRIKCNGARAERDQRLQAGDVLQLYINDEFFVKLAPTYDFLMALLGMGTMVEILKPTEFRDEFTTWVRNLSQMYNINNQNNK